MSTPTLGDLPDWQQLSAPNIQVNLQVNIASGQNVIMVSQATPIRVWGAWLNVTLGTSAAYAAVANQWGAQMQDDTGVAYHRAECFISAPSHEASVALFVPLMGIQVPVFGGFSRMRLITDAALTNATTRVNAGLLWSSP